MATQEAKRLNVVIVGASGETGRSITNALLSFPNQFAITAFARPSSLSSSVYKSFAARGVDTKAVDFKDKAALVRLLEGVDVVIVCLQMHHADVQNTLIEASAEARVGRFVPSFWSTVCPPKGVMQMRDVKEDGLNKIKALYLPFTVIDVGWWYQTGIPTVPSGKLDKAVTAPNNEFVEGEGEEIRSGMIDQHDVGKFVCRIISDPRTLNKLVFVYGEVISQSEIISAVEKHTGETVVRNYVSREQAQDNLNKIKAALDANPADAEQLIMRFLTEYKISCWIRGDNTPDKAKYLGYLDARELYPDLTLTSFDEFVKDLVEGKRTATVYGGAITNAIQ